MKILKCADIISCTTSRAFCPTTEEVWPAESNGSTAEKDLTEEIRPKNRWGSCQKLCWGL